MLSRHAEWRWAFIALLVILFTACATKPHATIQETRRLFCEHLASLNPLYSPVLATGSPASPPATVPAYITELRNDAKLLEGAGDQATARLVTQLADGFQALYAALRTTPLMGVFLTDGASPAEMSAIQTALTSDPDVVSIRFESKEEAYQRFLRIFADQPDLTRNVSVDALPASFRVTLKGAASFNTLKARIEGLPGVGSVSREVSDQIGTNVPSTFAKLIGICRSLPSVSPASPSP